MSKKKKKSKNGQIRVGNVTQPQYTVYTDGGCAFNPGGPGGYGAVIIENATDVQEVVTDGYRSTTNNRMEIMALVAALEALPDGASVLAYSDSQYLINCFAGAWARNKNHDLWNRLDKAAAGKSIELRWVRGHSGNKFNELCDTLATHAMSQPDLQPDQGYDDAKESGREFYRRVDKHVESNAGGAMAVEIIVPDALRTEIAHMSNRQYSEEFNVHTACASAIRDFDIFNRRRFKDYVSLKTGGRDFWSMKKLDYMLENVERGEEKYQVITAHLGNEKDSLTAMRWVCRGLPLDDAIRKVLVDNEVSANCIR